MKPFLKWVGGKTQILDNVLARFPRSIHNYYEPFLGGGSVLLGLLSCMRRNSGHQQRDTDITVTGTIYASDVNPTLIGLYVNVQQHVEELLVELGRLVAEFTACAGGTMVHRKPATVAEGQTSPESYYYWTRGRFNALTDRTSVAASAAFLFLNKTCFRGVYREGPSGFNVPFGHYKNPTVFEAEHLRAVSRLVQGVVFTTRSFETGAEEVATGDFVYMDPPYAPETDTSFVSYTADGFGSDHHAAVFALCRSLAAKRVGFLMSNADVKMVRDAFAGVAGVTVEGVVCRRAIHSKRPDATAKEVLIALAL
jgi:DNA adenine methylase